MKHLIFATLAIVLATPAVATDYRASNRLSVTQAENGRFVISGIPDRTPLSYWCAAGEYAQRVLDAGQNERIYVVGDYQRWQRSFTFSLSPAGTAAEQGRVPGFSVRVDGVSRKVGVARDDCHQRSIFRAN